MRPPFATFAALGLAGLIFLLALLSPTSYTNSDPRLSLLTAQALLEHGSSRLAPYAAALGPEYTVDNYRLSAIGDELFYAYPLGPSLFALPVVTVYRLAGYDMVDPAQEGQVQNLLSALTVALLFLAVSGLIREFDASIRGLGLALMLTLGSSLVSTGATALWNLNLATLFILLALRLLVRAERHGLKPAEAGGLGFSLFAAYLCRPTAALFIALCLFYLWIWRRPTARLATLTAGSFLLLSVGFSRLEYGLLFHPYYLPTFLGGVQGFGGDQATPLYLALYGIWLSPSRGLFVFSPLFLAVTLSAFGVMSDPGRRRLAWLGLAWILLQSLMVARFTIWWGGFSFGPRLLVDLIPAFVLLTGLAVERWPRPGAPQAGRPHRVFVLAGLALGLIGMFIHTGSGLFNPFAQHWNGGWLPPTVDDRPEIVFDWRAPQFVATGRQLCNRARRFHQGVLASGELRLAAYDLGRTLTFAEAANSAGLGPDPWWAPAPAAPVWPAWPPRTYLPFVASGRPALALLDGFTPPRPGDEAWAVCPLVRILFGPATEPPAAATISVRLVALDPWPPALAATLNGRPLQPLPRNGGEAVLFSAPADALRREGLNELQLQSVPPAPAGATWLRFVALDLESE